MTEWWFLFRKWINYKEINKMDSSERESKELNKWIKKKPIFLDSETWIDRFSSPELLMRRRRHLRHPLLNMMWRFSFASSNCFSRRIGNVGITIFIFISIFIDFKFKSGGTVVAVSIYGNAFIHSTDLTYLCMCVWVYVCVFVCVWRFEGKPLKYADTCSFIYFW